MYVCRHPTNFETQYTSMVGVIVNSRAALCAPLFQELKDSDCNLRIKCGGKKKKAREIEKGKIELITRT